MPATTPQAEQLRRDLATLTSLARKDLANAWAAWGTAEEARAGLVEILPKLVSVYGLAAGTLAADWYDELREREGIAGRFRAAVAALPDDLGTSQLAMWGVEPLLRSEADWGAARTLVDGGTQRRIVNMSRATITQSSVADPGSKGWMRIGSGACAFCDMLIGRGAVYSENTADFASHDHCNCSAVPAWDGKPRPVKPYTPSIHKSSPADRARVRAWIKKNQKDFS